VDVRRLEEVSGVDGYAAVVVGAPMILGWHRAALGFVKKHQAALAGRKTAYFASAMSLTQTDGGMVAGVPVWIDPGLAKAPANPARLGLRERYAAPANYLRPMLRAAPQVHPVSAAFFGGRLEYYRLPFWQILFVMLVIRAQPGDLRNETAVRDWAAQLGKTLQPG
jgi:menaquinone-dependent protoporphyrinogen IX oxidase